MAKPEEVSIVKYRSLDGELYDDEERAKRADAYWREKTNGKWTRKSSTFRQGVLGISIRAPKTTKQEKFQCIPFS